MFDIYAILTSILFLLSLVLLLVGAYKLYQNDVKRGIIIMAIAFACLIASCCIGGPRGYINLG